MSDFAFTFSPTDTQLRNFYEERKNVVWHVIIMVEGEKQVSCGTAFALDASGILMTCAHLTSLSNLLEKSTKIQVRRLDTEYYTAEILQIKKEWDMILLQVNGLTNCNYTKLSNDGNLSVDQVVVHIGHPANLLYSCLVGKVACECVDSPPVPTDKCDEYNPTAPTKRGYRILGDKFPRDVYQSLKERQLAEESGKDEVDYRLPVVLTYTLGGKGGSSGGPVFDGKGDVVGMLIRSYGSYDVHIHVSVLRVFFDQYKRKVAKVANQVGGSSQPKRKSGKISSAAVLEA